MTQQPVYIAGVGMTPFRRPSSYAWDYPDMVKESGGLALRDAGLDYRSHVQAVVCSYCYGEPTCGQRAVYELAHSGVPIFNVNNNCSSASSALLLARYLVQSGNFDCVMAVGFEKMESGLSKKFNDREDPVELHLKRLEKLHNGGQTLKPITGLNRMTSEVIRMFALAGREYVDLHPEDCNVDDFAQIAIKNRRHGLENSNACFYKRPIPTLEQVLRTDFINPSLNQSITQAKHDRMICAPITMHQSSLTADGSASAVLVSQSYLSNLSPNNRRRAIPILAQHMCTDLPSSFKDGYAALCGYEMSKTAAQQCYSSSGINPHSIDTAEVHDCFSINELLMYQAMGFTQPGTAGAFFRKGSWVQNKDGGNVYSFRSGGKVVVNPSGGLLSKGHPIGATGLAQCHELVTQLRHEAHKRQVPNCSLALQHNFGIGGAAVATLYSKQTDAARL